MKQKGVMVLMLIFLMEHLLISITTEKPCINNTYYSVNNKINILKMTYNIFVYGKRT